MTQRCTIPGYRYGYEYEIQKYLFEKLREYSSISNNSMVLGFATNFLHKSRLRPDIIVLARNPSMETFTYLLTLLRNRITHERSSYISLPILLDVFASFPMSVIEIETRLNKRSLGQILSYASYFSSTTYVIVPPLHSIYPHIRTSLERLNVNILEMNIVSDSETPTFRITKLPDDDLYIHYTRSLQLRYLFDLIVLYDLSLIMLSNEKLFECFDAAVEAEAGKVFGENEILEKFKEISSDIIPEDNVLVLLQYLGILEPVYELPGEGLSTRYYTLNLYPNKCDHIKRIMKFNIIWRMFKSYWFLGRTDNLATYILNLLERDEMLSNAIWLELEDLYDDLFNENKLKEILKQCFINMNKLYRTLCLNESSNQ